MTLATAQQSNVKLNSVLFAFEANSGTFATDTTGPFTGNSFQFSAEYAHTFKNVSWLSWYGKGLLKASITPDNLNKTLYDGSNKSSIMYPSYQVNGVASLGGVGYDPIEFGVRGNYTFDFGLNVGGTVAVYSNLMLKGKAEVGYTIPAPKDVIKNHKVFLTGTVQAYPFRVGQWKSTLTQDGYPTDYSIRELSACLGYSIVFPFGLGVQLDANWITHGDGTTTASGGSAWEFDSVPALTFNGYVRANATVSYAFMANASAYLQFRYEGKTLIKWPVNITNNRRGLPMHDYYVRAGISYKLGF